MTTSPDRRRGRVAGSEASQPPALRVDPDFLEEFPDGDALATECFINLIRASDQLMAELNRRTRADFQLSPTAANVLAIVEGAGEPLPPGQIAERAVVSSASVTSLLDTLEKRGLLRRTPHPDDRRMLLVELTAAGQAIVDRLLPGVRQVERELLSTLDQAEQRSLLGLLARLQARARDIAAAPAPPLGGRRRRPARLGPRPGVPADIAGQHQPSG